jgi:hypothetical protein
VEVLTMARSSSSLAEAYRQLIERGIIENVPVEPPTDFQYPSVFVPIESVTLTGLAGVSIAEGTTNAKLGASSNRNK